MAVHQYQILVRAHQRKAVKRPCHFHRIVDVTVSFTPKVMRVAGNIRPNNALPVVFQCYVPELVRHAGKRNTLTWIEL